MQHRGNTRSNLERERLSQICRTLSEALEVVDPTLSSKFSSALSRNALGKQWPLASLRMAIRDLLEMTSAMTHDQLVAYESRLLELRCSIGAIRHEFQGKRIDAVLKRGRIRNDEEFYLLNALATDMNPPSEMAATTDAARRLVEQYELGLRE